MSFTIEDLKRRAGVIKEQDYASLQEAAQELAESWINGNISYVLEQIQDRVADAATVSALTLQVYKELESHNQQDADSFYRAVVSRGQRYG